MIIDAMKQALEAAGPAMKEAIVYIEKLKSENAALRLAIEQAERQESYWQEEARRYAGNADFWREKAKRQPLTEEQLKPIADEYRILFGGWVVDFARAIERAHGIGGGE
jgi:hypothetical protein